MAASNLTQELEGFFISLGFDVNTDGVKEMASQVESTVTIMRRLVAVAGTAAGALGAFVGLTASSADEMQDFATANGVGVETLQELGFAASDSGSSLDAVKSSVTQLNRTIGEAALGIGRGKMAFKQLGLSAKDSNGEVREFDDVLMEVSDRMQGMSLQESIGLAAKLGIDPTLVTLLRQGSDAIGDLREEARGLGILNEDQVRQGAALTGSLRRVTTFFRGLKNELAAALFPAVSDVLDGFREWLRLNREIIRSTFASAIRVFTLVLSRMWAWIRSIVGGLIDLAGWVSQFRVAIIAASAALFAFLAIGAARAFGVIAIAVYSAVKALLAFNAAALLTPALIGAVIIALGLLIDDFMVWMRGGDSFLGEMFGSFPEAVERIKEFFSPLQTVIRFFSQAFVAAKRFGDYIRDSLFSGIESLWNRFKAFPGIGTLGGVFSPSSTNAAPVGASRGVLGVSATASGAVSTVDSSTRINEVNITVNSPDPAMAGRSVAEELGRRGMILTRNLQTGVL